MVKIGLPAGDVKELMLMFDPHIRRRKWSDDPQLPPKPEIPLWFKIMFGVAAVISLGLLGVTVWAVITIVRAVAR